MQFYLRTWLHSLFFTYGRPVESWSSFEQMFLVNEGKPNKLVLESLNFADDIVRGSNCRKRTIFKNWSDTSFINLN